MQPAVIIATTNPCKVREVRHILAALPLHLTTLHDYPPVPEPVEDADTFEGNARLKALYYADRCGGWTLADDSGLEVDALGGEPGVHSSRYAGPSGDSAANNQKLRQALASVADEDRTARFRCVVALARPSEVAATATGTVEGRIIDEARGAGGFGYDPHFFVPAHGMTAAEMPADLKNRISHRGQAFRAIIPALVRHLHLCA
jgi:XTP/dITP diphosphohydrolase